MPANPFDQFDTQVSANPFDQFDSALARPAIPNAPLGTAAPLTDTEFANALGSLGLGGPPPSVGFDPASLLQPEMQAVDRVDPLTGVTRPVALDRGVAIAHNERVARDPAYAEAAAAQMVERYPGGSYVGETYVRPDRDWSQTAADAGLTFRQGAREGVLGLVDVPRLGVNALNTGLNSAAEGLASALGQSAGPGIPMYGKPEWQQQLELGAEEIAAQDRQLHGSAALAFDESHRPDDFVGAIEYMVENPGALITDASRTGGSMVSAVIPGAAGATIAAQSAQQAALSAQQVEKNLIAKGVDPDTARAEASKAFASSSAIGLIAPRLLPGGKSFEEMLAGRLSAGVGGPLARVGAPLVGEPVSEMIEEGSIQSLQNVYSGDPWDQGVGGAAAMGGALGLGMGAGPAAVEGSRVLAERSRPVPKREPSPNAIDPELLRRGSAALADPEPAPAAPEPNDDAAVAPEDDADLAELLVRNLLDPAVAAELGIEPDTTLADIFNGDAPTVLDEARITAALGNPEPADPDAAFRRPAPESAPAAPPAIAATEVRTSQPAQILTPEPSGQVSAPQSAPAGAGADLGRLYQRGNGRNNSSAQALQLPDGTWRVRSRKAGRWQDWHKPTDADGNEKDTFDASPAFGYRETAMGGGAVNVPGIGRVAVAKADAQPKGEADYNPLLDMIAGAGGISRADAARMGVDPAELNRRRGIKPLYGKNGIPLDSLREMMVEEGYFPEEDPNAPPTIDLNDVWDMASRALAGEPVGPLNDGRMLDLQMQAQADRYGDEETQADRDPDEDLADWFDEVEREAGEAVSIGDEAELLSIKELAARAAAAGVPEMDAAQFTNESDAAYAARLWQETYQAEADRGTDRETEGSRVRDRVPAREVQESEGGFALQAPAEPRAQEVAPTPSAGLFGAPSARDFIDNAQRERDGRRDGKTATGRTDMLAGEGELFAGKRPEQASVPDDSEALELAGTSDRDNDWLSEASAEASREGGEFDADKLGLRPAVNALLGESGYRVEYLRGYEGLPERLRKGVERRNSVNRIGVTAALYDPDTRRVFIFTNIIRTPEEAVWNAVHEIGGHDGVRALFGPDLDKALEIALQNPTVAALAAEIYRQRNYAERARQGGKTADELRLESADEALAELQAAIRTGDYDKLAERYGVEVPDGIRSRVKAAIDNFIKRLQALFGKQGIVFKDSEVRELLEAAWQAADGNADTTTNPQRDSILESVEDGAEIPASATGRSILADGRLLTLIDAARAANVSLTDLRAAHASKDAAAAATAIDAILAKLQPAEPMRSTGTKNAVTDAERAAANRDPILREAVKTNEATLYEAMRTVKQDPLAGQEAAARLSRGGAEGISLADEAVLLVHKTELLNQRDAAAKKLADPDASEAAKEVARRAWEESEAQIAAIDMAAVNAGREWGRFGQFRQRMLRADFTFEALERKERARLERPLTQDESATVKAMAATIAELQGKVDKLEARKANAESEGAYEQTVKRMSNPKASNRREALRKAADEARRRLRETQGVPSRNRQSGAVISPSVFYDLTVIGAYHVNEGVERLSDWVAAMRADLGEYFDRFRDDHPNIFRAAKKEAVKPIRADATVAEALEKIDPANITPKDVRKLVEALVGEGLRGEPAVIAAAAEHLALAEDEVRALFVQTEPRGEPTLTEAQEELRDLRKIVRLQNEIGRLEAGEPKPARTPPAPDSPAVAAKKQELADLRASMRPQRDPEGRYQEMRGKQIEKRIAELQERIERGDFAKRPRVPRALNEANQRAAFELEKAKHEFLRHQFEDALRNRTPIGKIFGAVGDSFNLARAMMTSFDYSGLLRQGGFIVYGHPVRAIKSVGPSLRAFASERAEHRVNTEIASRPNAPLYRRYGLQLTGIGAGPLTQIEETYASRWLSSLPNGWKGSLIGAGIGAATGGPAGAAAGAVLGLKGGSIVRGSGRSYVALLNQLRADSFDAMAAALGKRATLTEAEGKAIAGYINVATGRGKVGKSETAAQTLNTVFFAPRLVASRFQLLVGQPLYGGNARTRKMIAVEYARFLMGVSVAISLAAFGFGEDDDDSEKPLIGFDPRSADFLKIRVGNTYLDPMTGLSQVTVFLSRLATGETVGGSGEAKPLRPSYTMTDLRIALGEDIPAHEMGKEGELPFGSGSAASVIGRFVRSKLAPVPGAIVNVLSGSNMIGEEVTPAQAGLEMVTPLSFQSIGDVMAEHGVPKATAMTLVSLLGLGMQHRDEPSPLTATDAARTDIKERLAKLPMDQWVGAMEEMRQEYGPILDGVELAIYKRDGKYGLAGEPRRTADGLPVLATERLSERSDYRQNYRESLVAGGMTPAQASRAAEKVQVHHLIPDNVVRQHPLMIVARTGAGYDLNRASNLVGMAEERSEATDSGKEIGHWTDHPRYDDKAVEALDKAAQRLEREYDTLEQAPRREVLDAVRKVEDAMRERIKRRDVPTKSGRLAALDEMDEIDEDRSA